MNAPLSAPSTSCAPTSAAGRSSNSRRVARGAGAPRRRAAPPPATHLRRGAAAAAPCLAQRRPRAVAAAAAATDEGGAASAKAAGRMTYRPESYAELVSDAAAALLQGIEAGLTRMEVEFPPIPTNVDAYKGSSDLFIDSNVQLALAAAKKLAAAGQRVHVVLPDLGEYARSFKIFRPSLEQLGGGVTLGHLKEAGKGGDLLSSWQGLFAGGAPDPAPAGAAADVFLITNLSCVELPNLEAYVNTVTQGRPVVTWNLELDSLRGDLGLLGLPPKDVHYRFLSTFRPVFFLRPRDYSKSVSVAPFIVNYSGALFREFPGPWQVMLKQDNGVYACIAEDAVRYNLGEVKEELMAAMGLNTEADGSVAAFLRRGYKTSTWFEDDAALEQSKEWRL